MTWREWTEIGGGLCVIAAAFLVDMAAGFLVMGVGLVVFANLGGSHADSE